MSRRNAGLVLIATLLTGCLLIPSDESARVAFTLRTPTPVPPPTDEVQDPTGQYVDLDRAGLYLRIAVSGPELEEIVGELVPDAGGAATSEFQLELDVPAGDARSFTGVAYLRSVPAGQVNTTAGATAYASDAPLVRPLEEGELVELDLTLSELGTGVLHGTISKAASGAERSDVTAVALVDAAAGVVFPQVVVHTYGEGPDRTFSFSIPGVPVGRSYFLRLFFLDATLQDQPETAVTLLEAGESAQRDIVLE